MANKETKFEVLDNLRDILVRDLQPEKHFAFLRSKTVLDEDDCEEICAKTTRRKKAEQFLDILKTKGESGFDYFCKSFIECGKTQLHLLNKVLDAYEEMIYENEVEQLPRLQQECINMEMLNEQLPKPGEPGAPCLPNHFGPSQLLFNGLPPRMNGDMMSSYDIPPPPYTTH